MTGSDCNATRPYAQWKTAYSPFFCTLSTSRRLPHPKVNAVFRLQYRHQIFDEVLSRIENGKADIRLSMLAKVLGSIGFEIVAMPQK